MNLFPSFLNLFRVKNDAIDNSDGYEFELEDDPDEFVDSPSYPTTDELVDGFLEYLITLNLPGLLPVPAVDFYYDCYLSQNNVRGMSPLKMRQQLCRRRIQKRRYYLTTPETLFAKDWLARKGRFATAALLYRIPKNIQQIQGIDNVTNLTKRAA